MKISQKQKNETSDLCKTAKRVSTASSIKKPLISIQ